MKIKNQFSEQNGNITIIAVIFVVAAVFLWQIYKPAMLSIGTDINSNQACRPDKDQQIEELSINGKLTKYKLVKSNAVVKRAYIDEVNHLNKVAKDYVIIEKKYDLFIVTDGGEAQYNTTDGKVVKFDTSGLLIATNYDLVRFKDGNTEYKANYYILADKQLPKEVYECKDIDSIQALIINETPAIIYPSPFLQANKTLQINFFTLDNKQLSFVNWFSFHCKPIVYLYPAQKEQVTVKLNPLGFLTESIPPYPKDGWVVTAYPSGRIEYKNKEYQYLYYESKIFDSETKIPKDGWVVTYDKLNSFYAVILPQLGLTSAESRAFIDYWQKALPKSPYYFIGVMDKASIDHIEPLAISPNPDTLIRVRFYFKPLDLPIAVNAPVLESPLKRTGFSVVEWGGMVKRDQNHPFTCSE